MRDSLAQQALLVRGNNVKQVIRGRCALAGLILATLALSACGTPPAKDFGGSWKPVNRFQSRPTAIPLNRAYTYYAAPMDETLKAMLTRWARDTDRALDYSLGYDVTLYGPVADIRTSDLQAATRQLNNIYAAQNVRVIAKPREIVVQPTGTPRPPSANAARSAVASGTRR